MNATTVDRLRAQHRPPGLGQAARAPQSRPQGLRSTGAMASAPGSSSVATTAVFVLARRECRDQPVGRSTASRPSPATARRRSSPSCRSTISSPASRTQFSVLAVIFATMSLLIAERDSGTLAWTISKPVSRTSVLVSKWLTATLVLWIAAFVIPIAITTGLVTFLYGAARRARSSSPWSSPSSRCRRSSSASPSSRAPSCPNQAAVGAIGLVLFILPSIVGGIVPAVTPFFPTSIFGWAVDVSTGGPISLVTPVAWAIGMAVLFVLGRRRLADMDL